MLTSHTFVVMRHHIPLVHVNFDHKTRLLASSGEGCFISEHVPERGPGVRHQGGGARGSHHREVVLTGLVL